ncbi:hypothetical protein J608_1481 [Acinetobacter baumannii 1288284]|nr:hypothetical protein J608_1481 [Acinetobacter baumannii 1288284]
MVRAVHAIAACAPLCPIASISAFKPAPPEGAKPEKKVRLDARLFPFQFKFTLV